MLAYNTKATYGFAYLILISILILTKVNRYKYTLGLLKTLLKILAHLLNHVYELLIINGTLIITKPLIDKTLAFHHVILAKGFSFA